MHLFLLLLLPVLPVLVLLGVHGCLVHVFGMLSLVVPA